MFLFIPIKHQLHDFRLHLNTSHVLIYQMVLLVVQKFCVNLNTSHVLIYPFKETDPTVPEWDLNTSHVLIYLYVCVRRDRSNIFKYISCSYLSMTRRPYASSKQEFKYISCSYLSMTRRPYASSKQEFKYISCSYLSQTAALQMCGVKDLNTSHVLIYPARSFTIFSAGVI